MNGVVDMARTKSEKSKCEKKAWFKQILDKSKNNVTLHNFILYTFFL